MLHTFTVQGYSIALDVFSGSVHVVDRVALEAIRLYETKTREETALSLISLFPREPNLTRENIDALLDILDELKNAGKLYSSGDYLRFSGAGKKDGAVVKALCLHVAHACNLTCSYCFAGQGRYKGQTELMSAETARKALDFLVKRSGKRRHLEVDFFGGEPLLNWEVVQETVRYGRRLEKQHDKVFRFTLTTNGVALNEEIMAFCNREMHNVVLSLDGRKKIHDHYRVDHRGQGSYDTVVPKFQEFVRLRKERGYYIRGTYTKNNLDFLEDIRHMADLGFTQLSMEPIVTAPEDPEALTEKELAALFEQYEQLALLMLRRKREGRPFDFYHFNIDLENGPCVKKRLSGCGSGTEYLAVTPNGDLYPCHQFVGDESFRMGSLDEGIVNQGLRDAFAENTLFSHEECRNCWAQLYCAGGCAANACRATGSISGVYRLGCELFKKRVECALMLQAALEEEENA